MNSPADTRPPNDLLRARLLGQLYGLDNLVSSHLQAQLCLSHRTGGIVAELMFVANTIVAQYAIDAELAIHRVFRIERGHRRDHHVYAVVTGPTESSPVCVLQSDHRGLICSGHGATPRPQPRRRHPTRHHGCHGFTSMNRIER